MFPCLDTPDSHEWVPTMFGDELKFLCFAPLDYHIIYESGRLHLLKIPLIKYV